MMIKVFKVGGLLLKEEKNISYLRRLLIKNINEGNKVVLVVSAIGRKKDPYATDTLKKYSVNLNKEDGDYLVSLGEIFSSLYLNNLLNNEPLKIKTVRVKDLGIIYSKKKFKLDSSRLEEFLKCYNVLITPGFIALNEEGNIVTLQRGASDLSALLICKMLKVKSVYLYKDVGAIMSGDPSLIASCYQIRKINYDDCYLLTSLGAKIIHKGCLKIAKKEKIKIYIKSLIFDEVGSEIYSYPSLNDYLGVVFLNRQIILVGKIKEEDERIIKELLVMFHIELISLRRYRNFMKIKVIEGKSIFALNIIHHHYFLK